MSSRPAKGEPPDLYNDPAYESDLERWTAERSNELGRPAKHADKHAR